MADFTDVLEEQREANSKSAGILMGQVDLKNIMQQQLDTMKNVFSNITTSLSPQSIQPVPPEPDEPDKPDKSESLFKKIASDIGNLFSKKKEAPSSTEEGDKETKSLFKRIASDIGNLFSKKKEAPSSTEEGDKETKSLFKLISKGLSGVTKGLGGLVKKGKDVGGKSLKVALFGAAFFALSKFLQSDMFRKVAKFISEELVPAIKQFVDHIMQPGGAFDSLMKAFESVGEFFSGLLDFVKGLFTGDTSLIKEGLNKIIDGITGIVGGLFETLLGLLGFSPESVAKISEVFGSFFGDFIDLAKKFIDEVIDAVELIFSGDLLGGLQKLIMAPINYLFGAIKAIAGKVIDILPDSFKKFIGLDADKEAEELAEMKEELERVKANKPRGEGARRGQQKKIAKLQEEIAEQELKVNKLRQESEVDTATPTTTGGSVTLEQRQQALKLAGIDPTTSESTVPATPQGTGGATNVVSTDNSTLNNVVNNSTNSTIVPKTITDTNSSIMSNRME